MPFLHPEVSVSSVRSPTDTRPEKAFNATCLSFRMMGSSEHGISSPHHSSCIQRMLIGKQPTTSYLGLAVNPKALPFAPHILYPASFAIKRASRRLSPTHVCLLYGINPPSATEVMKSNEMGQFVLGVAAWLPYRMLLGSLSQSDPLQIELKRCGPSRPGT